MLINAIMLHLTLHTLAPLQQSLHLLVLNVISDISPQLELVPHAQPLQVVPQLYLVLQQVLVIVHIQDVLLEHIMELTHAPPVLPPVLPLPQEL